MYNPHKILNGAPNARDLGGIMTIDGRKIKPHRLIRSGMLRNLDDRDVEYLKSIGLKTVVDFRTPPECLERPDRIIEGVEYIYCPMLDGKEQDISCIKPLSEDEEAIRTVKMAHRLMSHNPDGRTMMKSLYPMLVSVEHSIEHYRQFFEILLGHSEGALLYHCTMGKDRVGTGTALLLSALGVPRETIIEDYLLTGVRCAEGTEKLVENCRKICPDEDVLSFIRWLDAVTEEFICAAFDTIDELHGGMDSFLSEKMGLDEAALTTLRELYLE